MRKVLVLVVVAAAAVAVAATFGRSGGQARALPLPRPTVSEYEQLSNSATPPTEAQCFSAGRRCFTPQSMTASYDLTPLYASGNKGQGKTIAIVDSYGSDTIAHDLHVFDQAFGVQPMCGEEGVTCTAGMPTFSQLALQGSPATKAPPGQSNGTGLEDKAGWALEVSLDVEWAHATAPKANILLVTTPTAETLGVQGFPQMMAAEDYVVQNHLADVISQSFGSGEGAFGSSQSLLNLRYAFVDAQANHVSVFASSGDGGTANTMKQPVKNPRLIPYPSVLWPASDPLVTAVGGTYLCTDPTTGLGVDTADPPARCQPARNPGLQRETGWIDAGGGYSTIFSRPAYQNTLPPGSTYVGSSVGAPGPNTNMRGVPDIAYQASATTAPLVYITLPPDGTSGLICGTSACSTGWYAVGGTSASSPQWAGIAAIADQVAGRDLGNLNPALYQVAANAAKYAADFFDVTVNCNQLDPSIPGYCASPGWDAVTGLGTPNAANLIPDLIAATP
jgi:subtilase family serine protease